MRCLAPTLTTRYDGNVVDEPALIQQAKAGDLDAFNRLVLEYQSQVFNVAFRIMGDRQAADDMAQETFVSAFKGVKRFRGGSFRAWLLRILRNACYDEFRRRKRRPTTPLDSLAPQSDGPEPDSASVLEAKDEDPEQASVRSEQVRAIEECIQELPEEYRLASVLVDVQGYDYTEAAEVLDRPLGTIKSRVSRARARLRDCLRRRRELFGTAFRLEDETR
jgi:RNA polymerase sigma-70 factor (ECF subfamily)